MGKRSRRRVVGAPTQLPAADESPKQAVNATSEDEEGPPKPPWAPFPLTEIAVVIAVVFAVGGFLMGSRTGTTIVVVGLVLGSLAGAEQAWREHRAGYRSHTAVLAAVPAAVSVAVLAILGAPPALYPPVAIGVLIAAFLPIRSDFTRRQADRESAG